MTTSDDVAERVRRLRFHGSKDKATFVDVGYNSRLDELQAAALRVLLPELDGWNAARRAAAEAYERQDWPSTRYRRGRWLGPSTSNTCTSRATSVPTRPPPAWGNAASGRAATTAFLHRQPAMAEYAEGVDSVTEEVARTHLALPMGPLLTQEQVHQVVGGLAPLA